MYNYQQWFGACNSFYAAKQHYGESFIQFANRLCALAAYCDFENPEDELHYRFVMGLLPGPERSMLVTVELAQPLTFAKAVEFVEGVRYTRGVTTDWETPLETACELEPNPHTAYISKHYGWVCHNIKKRRRSSTKIKWHLDRRHCLNTTK